MKAFSIILTFIATLILFLVVGGQVFSGAPFIKFLFAFSLASAVVLVGWGMIDTMLPPQKKEHDKEELH
jgi:hypothetical protein